MKDEIALFLRQHTELTRRYFLRCGAAGIITLGPGQRLFAGIAEDAHMQKVLKDLESWLTRQDDFQDVSRGNPKPHSLEGEEQKEAGLTRESWQLEVVSDPEKPARLRNPLTKEKNTAFDFSDLMRLAKDHAVRFAKVMTCLNIGCPLGTGIWEGVPLREVLWLTQPRADLRRVFYHGFHNHDEKQLFRSSLPVGRVLEDPFDLPPVILCYKLNGQWLTPQRGGPVRVVVPESYGFKSIKWLSHLFLSNIYHANDTYEKGNNDLDSDLKTFCATLSVPSEVKPDQPIPITGYAQVGISGLKKVQVWLHDDQDELPSGGKYYSQAPWQDATILPAPKHWGGDYPDGQIPPNTIGFDPTTGTPNSWPIRLAKAHWATLLAGQQPGEYTLRCRTIDEKGNAQPMPRPFKKSGHAGIESVSIVVKN